MGIAQRADSHRSVAKPLALAIGCALLGILPSLIALYANHTPVWRNYRVEARGFLNDEATYWLKARAWAIAGFDSGYFTYREQAKQAWLARLGPHPQIVHVAQGLSIRVLGWHHQLPLLFNCLATLLGWLVFLALIRPQRIWPFLALSAAFWPLSLWLCTGMQTSLQIAIGVVAAGFFHRLALPERQPTWLHGSFAVFLVGASLARFTWALLALPYLLLLLRGRGLLHHLLAVFASAVALLASAGFYLRYTQSFPARWPTNAGSLAEFVGLLANNTGRNLEAMRSDPWLTSTSVVLVLALLVSGFALARGLRSALRDQRMDPIALPLLFSLAPVLVLAFVFYDWQWMRGERLLTPVVSLGLFLLTARANCGSTPVRERRWLHATLALALLPLLLGFSGYLDQQSGFWRSRFWSDARIESNDATRRLFDRHLAWRLHEDAWENTLAADQLGDWLDVLPAGIGVSLTIPRWLSQQPSDPGAPGFAVCSRFAFVVSSGWMFGALEPGEWEQLGRAGPYALLRRKSRGARCAPSAVNAP